ncbi:outer membrane ferric siderophore receptor [Alcanivorax nanhaiticus]|uniref:Outer membrane ferric siderophore receptor n=1 Tax=Alcanivorax nanhaiticus TaxID=1177154 RepID=A0A095SII6_9GAMM|nr:TonB-dependent siderophore receptor [Alcanivorax nanhaiticus]KGD64154.1 outer membrane ferric siderophore receptor [Alcanivorax nanhaiticus]
MTFRLLAGAVSASLLLQPTLASAEDADVSNDTITLEKVTVSDQARGRRADDTEAYTPKTPVSAPTGLSLTRRETPQSVSVITETQMDDFQMNGVSDVLASTPGVVVDRVETDRIYYNARGFEITNFQFDGLGQPLPYEIVTGDVDTAQFERVEVIRGSNGLMTGVGNSSATVNYVRKRPTVDSKGSLAVTYGSWNAARVEGDLSGALNKNGTVRGRVVSAYDNKDSYLDRYEKERGLFYGVVEADITDSTLLTLGYSQQNDNADSPLWGSLPLFYSDGTPTDYDVETSTSADWSYWDNDTKMAFVELQQRFDNGWEAKGVFTYRKMEGESELFYVYGTPNLDETGLRAYPSYYDDEVTERNYDLFARGPFEVGGRVHEMIVGLSYSKGRIMEKSFYGQGIGTLLTPDQAFGGSYPKPPFDAAEDGSKWDDRYRSGYLATRLSLAEPLTLIAGGRYVDVLSEGEGYTGTDKDASASELVPYTGVVYDLTDVHSVYASYTEIFNPQTEEDASGQRLDPVTGETHEIGFKSEWNQGRLYTQLTAFWTDQKNLAEAVPGTAPDNDYTGKDFESSGYEAEISGELLPGWQLSGGYTFLDIEKNDDGIEQRTYTPREIIRLTTSYRPSGLEKLKVGARVSWQDSIFRGGENGVPKTTQGAYTLVDLMAGYDWTKQFSTTLNVNNVSDEKYLNSLYVGQAFYGAPRNASIRFDYKF